MWQSCKKILVTLESALRWLTRYPMLPLQIVLMLLASWGWLGSSLGVEQLIWNERWDLQLVSGFGLGVLFGVVLFVMYLLDPPELLMVWLVPPAPQKLCCTLFRGSADPEIRKIGAYLFWWLLALLLIFALPKVGSAPLFGLFGILGYVLSLVFSWVLYRIDERFGIRVTIKNSNWFQKLPYIRIAGTADAQKARTAGRRVAEAAEQGLHAAAIYLGIVATLMIGLVYLGVVIVDAIWTERLLAFTSPVMYACVFLSFFSLHYGPIIFHLHLQRLIIGGAVLLLLLWNSAIVFQSNAYRMQFPNLNYEKRVLLQVNDQDAYAARLNESAEFAKTNLVQDEEVLKAMHDRWQEKYGKQTKPKIVLISASGGGIRAAAWSALVLEKLSAEPSIASQIRIIAGASGGILGSTLYVGDQFHPGPRTQHEHGERKAGTLTELAMMQSLYRTIQQMVLFDLTLSQVWPPPGQALETDRGRVIEQKWHANAVELKFEKSPLEVTFQQLREKEKTGEIPSLIFSPLMVEDSRRLLISNLNLEDLTRPTLHPLNSLNEADLRLGLPAIEFHRLFPNSNKFQIGTAARMAATFPFVTPAVSLPTDPPRRIVDAGYYDNFGMAVLGAWLHHRHDLLKQYTDGVVLVEIRAFPGRETESGFNDPQDFGLLHRIKREVLPAEFNAVLNLQSKGMAHRNAEMLNTVQQRFNAGRDRPFVQTIVLECQEETNAIPLNWYMNEEHKQSLLGAWKDPQTIREGQIPIHHEALMKLRQALAPPVAPGK